MPSPTFFVFFKEVGFCHVVQTDLELVDSSSLPTSASQSVGITDMSHFAQPGFFFSNEFFIFFLKEKAFRILSLGRGIVYASVSCGR